MSGPFATMADMNSPVDAVPELAPGLDIDLRWHNRFAGLGDAFFTRLQPTPLPDPYWVGTSPSVAGLLGLDRAWLASPAAL